jgi:hypothetical protein
MILGHRDGASLKDMEFLSGRKLVDAVGGILVRGMPIVQPFALQQPLSIGAGLQRY